MFDFTHRAILILKNVDVIATEDSRKLGLILKFLNFKNKILSLNIYNEITISKILINYIKSNKSVALVSDCGTPLINDPGFFLINFAYKNNIDVLPVPGISSFLTSLSISYFIYDNFIFEGFIPKNFHHKNKLFNKISIESKPIIFFEASNRLFETIDIMQNVFKDNRIIFISKDLTKKFQACIMCDLFFINHFILNKKFNIFIRGELVLFLNNYFKINYFFKYRYINILNKIKKTYFKFNNNIKKNIFNDFL